MNNPSSNNKGLKPTTRTWLIVGGVALAAIVLIGEWYWVMGVQQAAKRAQDLAAPTCFTQAADTLEANPPTNEDGQSLGIPACNMDAGALIQRLTSHEPRITRLEIADNGYARVVLDKGKMYADVYLGNHVNVVDHVADLATAAGIAPAFVPPLPEDPVSSFFHSWGGPVLMFAGTIFLILMLQRRGMFGAGGKGGAMAFGKSPAKKHDGSKVTFADVAGVNEAKADLEEIVEFLRDPGKFSRLGGKIPKGVLLVGPPGTGKTLIARAVAGEASTGGRTVPFFTISGSDFVEMFVGVGASRVRDMFTQAKAEAPCIIFIDEIDAVGRHRGAGVGGGNDEREQTLNQLLVEMDGFEPNSGVILIAATNRPDVLDPALLRPGRFDRQVVVPNPDVEGREAILKVHTKNIPLASDVNLRTIARGTPGFSGADLANLANEAALLAARRGLKAVNAREFEDAKDKVMMGAARENALAAMTEDEKLLTSYHEGAHTLVMLEAPGHTPLHKVTIVPRGRSLGAAFFLPERDKYSQSKRELRAHLESLYAGRLGELLLVGAADVTSGAKHDYQQATKLCRQYVMEDGFEESLPPLAYAENEREVFLGRSVAQTQNMSEETARRVDAAIQTLAVERNAAAKHRLQEGKAKLISISEALFQMETLTADQVRAIRDGVSKTLASDGKLSTALTGELTIEEFAALGKAARPHAEQLAKVFDGEPQAEAMLAACETFGTDAAASILEALPARLQGFRLAAAKAPSRLTARLVRLPLRLLGRAA